MKTKADTLSPKEEKFCQEITRGLSLSDAYRTAYKPKKAKDKTINEYASRLMAQSKISARVAALRAPVIAELQMDRAMWLKKLIARCNFDIGKCFDEFGNPIPIKEMDPDTRAGIVQFKFTEDYLGVKDKDSGQKKAIATGFTQDYRLIDPLDALRELGKAEGWYRQEEARPQSPFEAMSAMMLMAFLKKIEAALPPPVKELNARHA